MTKRPTLEECPDYKIEIEDGESSGAGGCLLTIGMICICIALGHQAGAAFGWLLFGVFALFCAWVKMLRGG